MTDMPNFYCPFCRHILDGTTHKYSDAAWVQFNCEYDTTIDEIKPLTELFIKQEILIEHKERQKQTNKKIKVLKLRISELNSFKEKIL